MTIAATEALDRSAIPWLFAVAVVTAAPHFGHLPLMLSGLVTAILLWGGWLWWRGRRLPNRFILVLCVAVAAAAILFEHRTLFGRDAGVSMASVFMALKFLEIRTRRDTYVIVMLGYFLLASFFFYSQSIAMGGWLVISTTIVTAALVRQHGGPGSRPIPTVRLAAEMTLQALPFMLVLYVLFPRVTGPLWGLPQDAYTARTGLSERMTPGSIANLVQNEDIAFRALFQAEAPPKNKLYWRGPVLEHFDGNTWTADVPAFSAPPPTVKVFGTPHSYSLTLEPHNHYWLFALDTPTALPAETRITPSLTLLARRAVQQRQRYELTAAPDYQFNAVEMRSALVRALRLPKDSNPRTVRLAEDWRSENPQPEAIVAKALAHFRNNGFSYTFEPPLLSGHTVDAFLFQSREGFCEHYAAAFVVLMRAAGVPARVVTGYQGGEWNPFDRHVVVRQSDAHAWAEVWIAGRGWERVDPTAVVAPGRIDAGSTAGASSQQSASVWRSGLQWAKALRQRWEAMNNLWGQWVLGYNPDRQRAALRGLGLPDVDWKNLVFLLFGTCALLLAAISVWILRHRQRFDPAQNLWNRALRKMRRKGISYEPWEAPFAFAARVAGEHPELGQQISEVVKSYVEARYGRKQNDLAALRAAVAALG